MATRASAGSCARAATLLALCASALGCGARRAATPSPPAVAREADPAPPKRASGTPRFVPDGDASPGSFDEPLADGGRRALVEGRRVAYLAGGGVATAPDRLVPGGASHAIDLPPRFGSGVLVWTTGAGATSLYRARSWLAPATPLAAIDANATDVALGFDRLYVRATSGELVGLDATTGKEIGLGPLPTSPRVGALAFADAWRGVVTLDLRGPLVTFDAGASFRPLAVDGPVVRATSDGASLRVETATSEYSIDAAGEVRSAAARSRGATSLVGRASVPRAAAEFALRDAVLAGVPGDDDTALVAGRRALARVRLSDGVVVESRRDAHEGEACDALDLGSRAGFACTTGRGATSLLVVERGLDAREIARFASARSVVASSRWGVLVRGGCGEGAADAAEGTFCAIALSGAARTFRATLRPSEVRAALLDDGRVAAVAPPRRDRDGSIELLGERRAPVAIPAAGAPAEVTRGSWLDSLTSWEDGSIGAWVEASGPLLGVRLRLDGTLVAGRRRADSAATTIAGRRALEWTDANRLFETTDGGLTWTSSGRPSELSSTTQDRRGCTAVGCAVGGWLRVGWGGGDLAADEPLVATPSVAATRARAVTPHGLTMRCEPVEDIEPERRAPPAASTRPPEPAAHAAPPRASSAAPAPSRSVTIVAPAGRAPVKSVVPSALSPFRRVDPPRLGADEAGVEGGTDPSAWVGARVYAYGPRGSDWSRAGHWLVRFDDPFARDGVRSTTVADAPPFADEAAARDALGSSAAGPVAWGAMLDPAGAAAIVEGCRGTRCDVYEAIAGQAPRALAGVSIGGRTDRLYGVVRVRDAWLVLSAPEPGALPTTLVLQAVEAGRARVVARIPRVPAGAADWVRLVRRAHGDGVGILTLGAPEPGRAGRDFFVAPIDLDDGTIGEIERIGSASLDGVDVARCTADDDGWLVDVALLPAPAIRLLGDDATTVSAVQVRARLDVGRACIDAIAARAEPKPRPRSHARSSAPESLAVPLVIASATSGRRFAHRCAR